MGLIALPAIHVPSAFSHVKGKIVIVVVPHLVQFPYLYIQ